MHSIPTKRYFFITRLLFYFLLKRCDQIHFVSKFLRSYYVETEDMRLPHTIIVYPGCNHIRQKYSENEKLTFRDRYNIPGHAKIILAQGLTAHYLKRDGARMLLDAFAQLSVEFPDHILLLTKEGRYLSTLKDRAVRLCINEKVFFTGNLKEPGIANAVADVYAHVTMGEGGISIALLEAMATGNPVVTTNVGGIPELITGSETAVMVNPSFSEVYNGLRLLCRDSSFCNLIGKSAKQFVRSTFTWEATSDQFKNLYKSLLN